MMMGGGGQRYFCFTEVFHRKHKREETGKKTKTSHYCLDSKLDVQVKFLSSSSPSPSNIKKSALTTGTRH